MVAVFTFSLIPTIYLLAASVSNYGPSNNRRMRYNRLHFLYVLETYAELLWAIMGVTMLYLGYTAVLPGRHRNTWKTITPLVVMVVFWLVQDYFAYVTAKSSVIRLLDIYHALLGTWVMRALGHGLELFSVAGILVIFTKRKAQYSATESRFIPVICGSLIVLFLFPLVGSVFFCVEIINRRSTLDIPFFAIVNNVLVSVAAVVFVFAWNRIVMNWAGEDVHELTKLQGWDGWPRFMKKDRAVLIQQALEHGRATENRNAFGQPIPTVFEAPAAPTYHEAPANQPAFPGPNAVYPTPARPVYA